MSAICVYFHKVVGNSIFLTTFVRKMSVTQFILDYVKQAESLLNIVEIVLTGSDRKCVRVCDLRARAHNLRVCLLTLSRLNRRTRESCALQKGVRGEPSPRPTIVHHVTDYFQRLCREIQPLFYCTCIGGTMVYRSTQHYVC